MACLRRHVNPAPAVTAPAGAVTVSAAAAAAAAAAASAALPSKPMRRCDATLLMLLVWIAVICKETGCSYVQTGVYAGQGGAGVNKVVVGGSGGGSGAAPTPPLPLAPPSLPQPPPLGPGSHDAPIGRNDPYFDSMTPRNVTALVGKSAYLSCRVRNLGNRTVSWIRHRDIHILTVGGYTYTSDQRFQANHHRDNEDWTLQIKWAQKRDAGVYECQISTQPVRSYFVNLNIVVPTAQILGGPDLHVDRGSTINLTCIIKYSPEPPAYIFWYHHDEVISYDSSRGGVSVITEKGEVTTSYLLIQHAELADSGKYSCSPSNADVASVRVHVLNGERPAAMQTGSAGLSNSSLNVVMLIFLCLLYSALLESAQLLHPPAAPSSTSRQRTRAR